MALDEPRKRVDLTSFGGLMSNADPFDVPDTHAVQMENVTTLVPGALSVRKGHTAATFSNAIAPATGYDVLATYFYPGLLGEFVIYTLTSGAVKAGRAPS